MVARHRLAHRERARNQTAPCTAKVGARHNHRQLMWAQSRWLESVTRAKSQPHVVHASEPMQTSIDEHARCQNLALMTVVRNSYMETKYRVFLTCDYTEVIY